jgi:hypothetical protein
MRNFVGGEGGIRTLDTGLSPYNALAGRHLRPLGHLSALICRTGTWKNRLLPIHPWPQVAQAPAKFILCAWSACGLSVTALTDPNAKGRRIHLLRSSVSPALVSIGRLCYNLRASNAPVAQLDRVLGYEPRGRGFKSCRARQTLRACSPAGPLLFYTRYALAMSACTH